MSNHIFATQVETTTGEANSVCEKTEIDLRFNNKLFHFTRENKERLDQYLRRVGLKITASGKSSSRRQRSCGKKEEDADAVRLCVINDKNEALSESATVAEAFVRGNSLCIGGVTIPIQRDPCRILRLESPKSLVVGCPAIPIILDSRSATAPHKQLVWKWRLSSEQGNASQLPTSAEVASTMAMTPSPSHEGFQLEIECQDATGNVVSEVSSATVQKGWPSRLDKKLPSADECAKDLVLHSPFEALTDRKPSRAFRVVTYNILHDSYASTDTAREKLYPYVEMKNLEISTRKLRIAKEIIDYNADIISLQEVGRSIFEEYLSPLFRCFNYEGYFESKSRTEKREGVHSKVALDDGCAILWNTEKFECVEKYSIPLTGAFFNDSLVKSLSLDSQQSWLSIRKRISASTMTQKAFDRLVMKGIFLHLRLKGTDTSAPRDILVANTHLFWHPSAKHMRLIQAHMLISTLDALRREKCPDAEIVLCGDLNSMPNGGVYDLLSRGVIDSTHSDWKDCVIYNQERINERAVDLAMLIGLPTEYENDVNFGFTLSGIQLIDSCAHWTSDVHTNYTPNFKSRLDYIFHSKNVACIRTLRNPSVEELGAELAIPSSKFPSDHVAVVADLELI
ncbi:hypothetical protein XU18_1580 [Perkinsela sp. CCAP 1560/4]|nr:hypothetical protein XU18_1580 [Perkinsela sp. CCAP 1560/4]|eukprot:KNH07770.1 hypothetical protein XU18_1580 [Perkinsela sp. CCAP 1560/4]